LREKFSIVFLADIASVNRESEVGYKNHRRFLEKEETDVIFVRN
jgi:hypothetical protein